MLITPCGTQYAAADAQHGQLWAAGRVTAIDRGAETLMMDGGAALVLSGETDCLSLLDIYSGQLLITAPVGMYPQQMCLAGPKLVAVCGGADGMLHLIRVRDLHTVGSLRLPGFPQRVALSGGRLYVLCAMYDEALHCLLYSISSMGRISYVLWLPGLAGALCGDGMGGLWAASSETLIHLTAGAARIDKRIEGTGLIRYMACSRRHLLTSDPVLGLCRLYSPEGRIIAAHAGDVGQGLLL